LAPRREDRPASAADVLRRLDAILNAEKDLEALLTSDETTVLEFKSSLRTPVGPSRSGDAKTPTELKKVLEQEVLKTLAAFLNTRGGTLVIGVDDSKEIVGIEVDYPSTRGSADGWRRVFDNLISQHIPEALGSLDLQLAPYRGRTVAIIRCRVRGQPTWLDDELFVRRTASTERLRTKQAWEWLQERSRPAI
jgi:predicted HTH transcriptional regulator